MLKLTPIEGNTQMLDGGAMYGNAPRALWQKWSAPDSENRIKLAARALLVQTENRNILLETGIGAFFEPKLKKRYGVIEEEHMLVENLKSRGLNPEDIDTVVLSHLHFDHAGGMLPAFGDGEAGLVFAHADILLGRKHWEHAKKTHIRDRASFTPTLHDLLESSGRLRLIDEDSSPPIPEMSFIFSDGHTPGMMLTLIQTDRAPLLFCADLAPGIPWVHLPITMGYDRFPELLVDEKQRIFSKLIKEDAILFFTHDPDIAFARLKRDEKSGRYYAESADPH